MPNTWFISDTHFGHAKMLLFTDALLKPVRPEFSSVEEMDEAMVARWNERVKPGDRIYHLGDVVIRRRDLVILKRLSGRKVLLRGNHDIFKLADYVPYFDDIRAYKTYPEHGIVCSHVPVHPQQLENRFKVNVHGHLHTNVIPDPRYVNICVEHTGYAPISLEELLTRCQNTNTAA